MSSRTKRASGTPKCLDCGAPMRASREPHRYTITPTWAITIADAEILRCPKCGTWEAVIPKPDALQRTIAGAVIRKPAPLAGAELAFLRRCLGLNSRQLAQALGIMPETLSRYENEALRVAPTVDRLVRMMVAGQFLHGREHFGVEALASIDPGAAAKPLNLVVTIDPQGTWRQLAA